MIALSLGEAEALARKAARGAGRSWGMAEEFGRAVRWLEGSGLPAMALLATLLARTDGMAATRLTPSWEAHTGLVHPDATPLCPIALGTALSDHGITSCPLGRIGPVWAPVFVVPHLADMARRLGQDYWLICGETRVCVTAQGAYAGHDGPAPDQAQAAWIACAPCDAPTSVPTYHHARAHCEAGVHNQLSRLAERLYAPETAARRQSGAGETRPGTD